MTKIGLLARAGTDVLVGSWLWFWVCLFLVVWLVVLCDGAATHGAG